TLAAERQAGPMSRPAGAARLQDPLEDHLFRQRALSEAAQLQLELERLPNSPLGFPLRIEPQARSLLGMLSQVDLISVAVVKAWRKRMASLQIQKMGQHLDH